MLEKLINGMLKISKAIIKTKREFFIEKIASFQRNP